MAELGAHLLIEDNVVSGPAAQQLWRAALTDLPTAWVGVHGDPATAAQRELARGNRTAGMAQQQAVSVHLEIDYDLAVDSTGRGPDALAHEILDRWFR